MIISQKPYYHPKKDLPANLKQMVVQMNKAKHKDDEGRD
jgi:hypothetical protein